MTGYALGFAVAAGLALTGCETPESTPNRAGTGAIMGAGIGAASGALIAGGHHGAEGALIGGGLGAVPGGLIGHSMEEGRPAPVQAPGPHHSPPIDPPP